MGPAGSVGFGVILSTIEFLLVITIRHSLLMLYHIY
jgi:hypothetical protein